MKLGEENLVTNEIEFPIITAGWRFGNLTFYLNDDRKLYILHPEIKVFGGVCMFIFFSSKLSGNCKPKVNSNNISIVWNYEDSYP